jgi:hypothetical protein
LWPAQSGYNEKPTTVASRGFVLKACSSGTTTRGGIAGYDDDYKQVEADQVHGSS